MTSIKCTNCGGQYCDLVKKEESFEETTYIYYCSGCKKNFSIKSRRSKVSGDWLLTIYLSTPHGVLRFYQNSQGAIFYNKIVSYYDEYKGLHGGYGDPTFSTHYEKPMLYVTGIDVWMSDAKDTGMIVKRIELNPSLTSTALQNEAMRSIHTLDNSFVVEGVRNEKLLKDISIWLRSTIKATDFRSQSQSEGCYIATCVYGSYDCPQVWVLRRFRDNALASTWYGRAFIRTYYAISPALVKWLGHTSWFKKMWRGKLDALVRKLLSAGMEDTPYTDINW